MPPIASPAAEVTACCSAMPTSKARDGYADANACSPVGPNIAADNATTSGRDAPTASISAANTSVHVGRLTASGAGTGPIECMRSASSVSAAR